MSARVVYGLGVAVLIALGGCDHADPSVLSPERRVVGQALPAPEGPWIAGYPLRNHEDYDRLEARFERRAALPELRVAYERLGKRRPDDLLLALRTVSLVLRDATKDAGKVEAAIPVVERMRQQAPKDPDSLYALLLIKRFVLFEPRSRTFFVPKGRNDIARLLVEEYDALLAAAPDYVGPQGVDATALRDQRAAMARVLTAAEAIEQAEHSAAEAPDPKERDAWKARLAFYEAAETQHPGKACPVGREAIEAAPNPSPALVAYVERICASAEEAR